jgi:predicted cupin superfamily sugar epimerase
MQLSASYLVEKYQLTKHPEGGYYKETYKSELSIPGSALPNNFGGDRVCSTAIYFLLEQGHFSAFHKIKSDECWHFYAGQTLEVFVLNNDGILAIIRLGNDIENGEVFQYVVPANCWFASRPAANASFSFVGCTVAPGFDFRDFELATKQDLLLKFPQHEKMIEELCIL